MTRRSFIGHFLRGLTGACLGSVAPSLSVAAGPQPERHYRPLNGRSLREMAERKMHHGDSGRFVNPLGTLQRERNFGRLLRWKLFSENSFSEHLSDQPTVFVDFDPESLREHRGLSLTFIKHACVLIKDVDRILLVDPVFDPILWFIQDFSPLAFDTSALPGPDHILLTHGHYDHLDTATLSALPPSAHVISPLGYGGILDEAKRKNRTHLDWYQSYSDGVRRITLVPANHWTMRNPIEGPNRALWGGYVIETLAGPTIYLSGDTAYFDGFDQIGNDWDIDLAVFNLGAYEPRWFMAPSHINPAETVQAFQEIKARRLMIAHWGTFRLGDEPVHFPPLDLDLELQSSGIRDQWLDLRHGQTAVLEKG
ncbi:MAG: MBL fold metallo-hydrolase [Desulfobacteraceae bacterium]|nr:MBL fold metallo-hydrolase [Desulfobacteraceae bacterium]